MTDVLAPAIAYARDGFPVSEVIPDLVILNKGHISQYPHFAET